MANRFVFLVLAVLAVSLSAFAIPGDRATRLEIAKKLYGRIRVVNERSSADYLVYVSDYPSSADLRVFATTTISTCAPGFWCFIDGGIEDFKVFFVDSPSWADVSITFTEHPSQAGPMP